MKLFVYGSLMTDGKFFNHIDRHVEDIRKNVYVFGKLVRLDKYPSLVLNPENVMERVAGELLTVTRNGLMICDGIEGYNPKDRTNSLYRRETTIVHDQLGNEICPAVTYVGNHLYPSIEPLDYWWNNKTGRIETI